MTIDIQFTFTMSKPTLKRKPGAQSKFSYSEDTKLRRLVKQYGPRSWSVIANGFPNKTPKQCRDRWANYLKFESQNLPWTNDEDLLLMKKYNELGTNWNKIQPFFANRVPAEIRNRCMKLERALCKVSHLVNYKFELPKKPKIEEPNSEPVTPAIIEKKPNFPSIFNIGTDISMILENHKQEILSQVFGDSEIEANWMV